ncbi:MAG: dethiobiotin synthase [Bacillota bacterium]
MTETQTGNEAARPTLPSLFITGTDTGVGKTVLSALLGLIYQSAGLKTAYLKPVETGAVKGPDGLVPGDTRFVSDVLGLEESIDVLCPYRFEHPVSPHLAGRMGKKEFKPQVVQECFKYLEKFYDAVIVEGAGGLLVPLSEKYMVADLARDLGLPVVITARPGLGTINHTLLTIAAALQVELKVAGVVVNRYPEDPDPVVKDNPRAIAKLSGLPVLARVPELDGLDAGEPGRALLEKAALELNRLYRLDEALAKLV